MLRARTIGRAILLAFAVAGCAPRPESATAPAAPAGITTDRSRYQLTAGPYGPEARIITTFRAPRDTTAWILHCNGAIAWGLQRLKGSAWQDAWVAMTNQCLSPAIVVRGDSAFVDTLVFTPSAGAVIDSTRVEAGTYRVVLYNVLTAFDPARRPFGPELPIERRVSAAIVFTSP